MPSVHLCTLVSKAVRVDGANSCSKPNHRRRLNRLLHSPSHLDELWYVCLDLKAALEQYFCQGVELGVAATWNVVCDCSDGFHNLACCFPGTVVDLEGCCSLTSSRHVVDASACVVLSSLRSLRTFFAQAISADVTVAVFRCCDAAGSASSSNLPCCSSRFVGGGVGCSFVPVLSVYRVPLTALRPSLLSLWRGCWFLCRRFWLLCVCWRWLRYCAF